MGEHYVAAGELERIAVVAAGGPVGVVVLAAGGLAVGAGKQVVTKKIILSL